MSISNMLSALGDHYELRGSVVVRLVTFRLNATKYINRWRLETLDGTDFAYLPVDDDGCMSGINAAHIAYVRVFHELR